MRARPRRVGGYRPTLAALLVLLLLAPGAFTASVTPLPETLPRAMVGGAGVFVDGRAIIMGGRVADGSYLDSILRDRPGGGTELLGVMPANAAERAGRYAGAAVVLDGQIYYFGGATLKQMSVPDGRGGTTTAHVPTASADILRTDPATGQTTILPAPEKLKKPAFGMAAVAYKGKAYILGGFYFDFSDPHPLQRLDTITVYDPRAAPNERVTQLSVRLPYPVQDAAAALLDNRIVLLGGLSDNDNSTNRCSATDYVAACVTDNIITWTPDQLTTPPRVVGKLPYRVEFVQAPVVNGKAYVIGGLLTDGTASTSILEVAPTGTTGQVTTRVLVPTLPQGRFGAATVNDGRNVTLYGGRVDFRDDNVLDTVLRVEPGPTAPWSPRNATASAGARGVTISWDPPRYDGETVVSSYNVYRALKNANATLVGSTGNLAFDDAGACPGVETLWRVHAVNARGESETGTTVVFTPPDAAPPAPRNVSAFGGNAEVVLRWLAPFDTCEVPVSGYTILRDGLQIARTGPVTEYRDTHQLVNGRVYSYQIRAYNARGDGPVSDFARATPAEVPAAPRGLTANPVEDRVHLTWNAPNEPVSWYLVHRSASPGGVGDQVGNVSTTSFEDQTAQRGRTYFYTVRAVNIAGQSPPSEIVPASLVRKPGPPTDVVALGRPGEVLVSWQAPIDTGDAPASALRYFVTRGGGGQERPIIVKTDIETLAFRDRNVTPGQTYTYSVTTLNPQSSPPSEAATATPQAVPNQPPVASLTAFPTVVLAGEPVELDASQSSDPDGAVREYVFDFGDGTDPARTTQPAVKHSYHSNGTYTATVVVKDDRGVESTRATVRILVGEVTPDGAIDPDTGIGGPRTPTGTIPTSRPGTDTPAAPVPGLGLAFLVVLAVAALVWRRR